MKHVHILSLILIIALLVASTSLIVSYIHANNKPKDPVYVGVSFGGTTVAEAKLLIDRVKSYTNLFILHSGVNPLSRNETATKEVIDYAVNSGLSVIINLGTYTNRTDWAWRLKFLKDATQLYGTKFLGAYYDDEPSGVPLDWDWSTYWTKNSALFYGDKNLSLKNIHYRIQMADITGKRPDNYTEEAQWYNILMLNNQGHNDLKKYHIKTFTSDYALYWYDYLGGYDVMLAQLGWNHTTNQDLSLIRGAAKMQNKDWGAIITWKYKEPPFLDTGENMYDQMVTAYNAGAKYISVFNYPYNNTYPWANNTLPTGYFNGEYITDNPYGVMLDGHFQALEKFWNQVVSKTSPDSAQAEAVLVLPKDYGWGMRSIDDKIWGFWGPDDKSPVIWEISRKLLDQYGLLLDIIYDDPDFPVSGKYSKIYYWNETLA